MDKDYAFISKDVKDCWVVRTLLERSERERRLKEGFGTNSQDEKTPAEVVQDTVAAIERRIELQRKSRPKRLTLFDIPDDTYDYSLNPRPPPVTVDTSPKGSEYLIGESPSKKQPGKGSSKKPHSQKKPTGNSSGNSKGQEDSPTFPSTHGGIFELDDYLHEDDSQPLWTIKADPVVFEGRRVFAYKSQDLKQASAKSHIQLQKPWLIPLAVNPPVDEPRYPRSSRGEPEVLYEGPMVSKKVKPPLPPPKKKVTHVETIGVSTASRKEVVAKLGVVNPYNWTSEADPQLNPRQSVIPGPSYRRPNTAAGLVDRRDLRQTGVGGKEGTNAFGLGILPLTQKIKESRGPSGSKKGKGTTAAGRNDPVVSSILECIGCPKRDQKMLKGVFTEITEEIKGKDPLRIKSLMKNRFIDWPDAVVQWKTELHKDRTYDTTKKNVILKNPRIL